MAKAKRRSDRKRLVWKLDKAFSEFIKARDGRCVTCGSRENLQCGHLFSRVAYSTRWDPMNAYCQCRRCNLKHEYDPGALTTYFLSIHGKEAYEELYAKFRSPKKFSNADLLDLLKLYSQGVDYGGKN